MAEYVKKVNGHNYRYREYWDKAEKRVKWQYLGKAEEPEKVMPKTNKDLLDAVFSALYAKCEGGDFAVKFDRRQLRRLSMHIREVKKEFGL